MKKTGEKAAESNGEINFFLKGTGGVRRGFDDTSSDGNGGSWETEKAR